jgi:hypothetical protein
MVKRYNSGVTPTKESIKEENYSSNHSILSTQMSNISSVSSGSSGCGSGGSSRLRGNSSNILKS